MMMISNFTVATASIINVIITIFHTEEIYDMASRDSWLLSIMIMMTMMTMTMMMMMMMTMMMMMMTMMMMMSMRRKRRRMTVRCWW